MPAKARAAKTRIWKKGRGKLGAFAPLFGTWTAKSDSAMGSVTCMRTFAPVLGGSCVQLNARWEIGTKTYEELALFRPGEKGSVEYLSFTSDGKHARGKLVDVSDVHPEAVGFEAQMPAGLARMVYWPDEGNGFRWAVESRNKKGWNRFTEHHYRAVKKSR